MGKTLADGYLELRLDPSKLDAETKAAFKQIGFKQKGQQAGEEAGSGLAAGIKGKLHAGLGSALGAIGIGAGIGAGVTSGLTQALDVGKANDKLRAQLNLTKDESSRLGKAAGQLYSKGYGESMGEVNDAISSVIRNVPELRNASVPVLKEISAGALDIARVFDQDVGGVTSAVSSMLKSGLAPNAQAALDVLSKGFQSGADKGGDLLDTFTEYSVQFEKLGLDAPSSLGAINQLLAGGARNADVAADAFKEFSIRAIDGSKSTKDAFKTLGVDYKGFTGDLAAGGDRAKGALSVVVDELNATKDPLERNRVGVELFGTKWEDLGDSFRNLNLDTATDSLGKLAGATKGLADQSDSSRIQGFIRGVQTGFVSIIGGQVIPKVKEFATAHREELAGALKTVTGIWNDTLLPALKTGAGILTGTVIPAISSLVGWMKDHNTVVKVAAVVAAALFAVYKVGSAIIAVQAAGGLLKYLASMNLVTTATKIWAGIQAVMNVILTANPIGIVVIAIAALVAIVIVAYKNSETFRNIVQAAWKGIQDAVSYAWNNVIKPAVSALVGFFQNVIAPAAMWLWKSVFQPVFNGIAWAVKAAWVIIQIIFKAWQLYLTKVIFPVIRFLYDNVVKPVFQAIGKAISWAWTNLIRPTFNSIKDAFTTVGTALKGVWDKTVKPMFSTFGDFLKNVVAPAFGKGVDAIKAAWEKIKDAAKAPVKFVVNSVINPFIGGINKIAGAVGVKDRISPIPGFASGGQVGGRISGTPSSVDNRLAPATIPGVGAVKLAGGEYIVNAADTSKALPLLRWINSGMKGGISRIGAYLGRGLTDYPGDGSEGWAFADGGLVGWAKDVWGAISNPTEAIKKPFQAALSNIPGGGMIRDFLVGAANRVLNGAIGFLTGVGNGTAGGNIGKAQAFLHGQAGKPYVWASAGPGGYDCSGIVSAVYNVMRGNSPYSHTFSTGSLPGRWFRPGAAGPLMAGWSHPGQSPASASVGHMAGQVGNLPFESTGSAGVRVGGSARRIGAFANRGAAIFDNGGTLMPGWNTVFNGLGKPEPLVRADRSGEVHIHIHDSVIASDRQAVDLLVKAYKAAKRERRI